MKKVILASLLGMLVLFIWGFISWTVFHLHGSAIQELPEGDSIATVLDQHIEENGAYYYPGEPPSNTSAEEYKTYTEKHENGPLFMVLFKKDGAGVMDPAIFIRGLIIQLLITFLISYIMKQVVDLLGVYLQRVLFVTGLGLIAVLGTYFTQWNWFYYPTLYTVMMSVDLLAGWILAGLVISAIIKPEHKYKV